jgi:hypothetical protein
VLHQESDGIAEEMIIISNLDSFLQ